MAQAIINTNERVNSSIHATHKDVNFLREHLVSRHDSLNSDLNVSSESLDTGIESDFSGSTESLNSIASDMDSNFSGSIESLDSLDAEGQPIFGTFSFKRPSEQTGIEQKESQTRSELKRRNATRRDSIFPPELPPKRQKQTAPPRPFKPDHLRRPGLSSNRRDLPAPPAPQQESPSATVQQQPERKETGLLSLDSKAQVEPEKVLLLLEQNDVKGQKGLDKKLTALAQEKDAFPKLVERVLAAKSKELKPKHITLLGKIADQLSLEKLEDTTLRLEQLRTKDAQIKTEIKLTAGQLRQQAYRNRAPTIRRN